MKPKDKQTEDGAISKVNNKVYPKPKTSDSKVKRDIHNKYTFGNVVLGAGQFGKVLLAENKNDLTMKVAVKALSKQKFGKLIKKLKLEVVYLKKLDSPNIVKYYETYEDENYVYIVMEYCPGGELFDIIANKLEKSKKFKEREAAEIMQNLLKAVAHVHS